jgi:hypothetical protein
MTVLLPAGDGESVWTGEKRRGRRDLLLAARAREQALITDPVDVSLDAIHPSHLQRAAEISAIFTEPRQ